MSRGFHWLAILAVSLGAACARPAERVLFDREVLRAERRAGGGDRAGAAVRLGGLAGRAYLDDDRVRLRLRAADLYAREGRFRRSLTQLRAARRENLDREEAGLIRLRHARLAAELATDTEGRTRLYLRLLERMPDTVAARLALRDTRLGFKTRGDEMGWLAFLARARVAVAGTRIEQAVAHHEARAEMATGQPIRAALTLTAIYLHHPRAHVWHTASVLLASLLRRFGRMDLEARVLRSLVRRFEIAQTGTPGNYDSALYTRGEIRLAELYCGELGRPWEGVRLMEGFAERHPSSSLRDDALWQIARCHDGRGDAMARRATLCRLLRTFPRSRYARRARGLLGIPIGSGPGGSGAPGIDGGDPPPCRRLAGP